jgi:hypothetical protein
MLRSGLVAANVAAWAAIILFARAVNGMVPTEYQPNYDLGYGTGYATGYESGLFAGTERGTSEGKARGKTDGYNFGWSETYQPSYDRAYAAQYPIGNVDGLVAGALDGFDEGFNYAPVVANSIFGSASITTISGNYYDSYGSLTLSGGGSLWIDSGLSASDYVVWRGMPDD